MFIEAHQIWYLFAFDVYEPQGLAASHGESRILLSGNDPFFYDGSRYRITPHDRIVRHYLRPLVIVFLRHREHRIREESRLCSAAFRTATRTPSARHQAGSESCMSDLIVVQMRTPEANRIMPIAI